MLFKLAVFGNPIAHSLSPKIHPQFAAQFGFKVEYQKILAPLDGFDACCRQFFDQGGYGCNVTLPFKEAAYRFVNHCSSDAEYAKAVNTILLQENKLYGDNTDGQGLVNDLIRNKDVCLKDKNILVLGAGGAVRGIVPALLKAQPRQIIIVNRTVEKAQQILSDFGFPPKLIAISWQEFVRNATDIDLLIDGTSGAVAAEMLPSAAWNQKLFVYDLKYVVNETPLVHQARLLGFQACDGFGMLVEQAALAFQQWFNVLPNTLEMVEQGPQALLTKE